MSLNSSTLIEQYPLIFSRESEQRSKHASAAGSDGISDGVFTERLRAHADEEYSSSVCAAVRSRLGWLALFLVGLWGAAFVIDWFEHMLQRNVELAHFVPLIIGHGGNAGSQAVGSVIRALAAKELDPSLRATFARVVSRETLVGGRCGGDTVDYDPAEYASFTLRSAGCAVSRWARSSSRSACSATSSPSTLGWLSPCRCLWSLSGPTSWGRPFLCWQRGSDRTRR
mmetsp:Transcript_9244/g.29741  ORF Transcript_9244/g.29741 Transcript_9244/m.29741 type:complete len:227 (+) Transcript_9244:31-711(+)